MNSSHTPKSAGYKLERHDIRVYNRLISPKSLSKKRIHEAGIGTALALVSAFTGLVLVGTVTQSWYSLTQAKRENLANAAQAAAEAGATKIMSEMNTDYPYLLIVNEEDWDNPPIESSPCGGNLTTGEPAKNGSVGNSGSFELIDYNYDGNQIFGGTAEIRVKGTASNSNNLVTATSIIEKKIQILPKNCNSSFDGPNNEGFPGLWAQTIDMGNNDIYGSSGNILCTQCKDNIPSNCSVNSNTSIKDYTESDKRCVIGGNNNMVVGGEIYLGPVNFPQVPRLPSALNNVSAANISSTTEIVAGSTKASDLLNGSCIVNTEGVTQCKIDEINLTGNRRLIIKTSSSGGPVQIYIVGNKISLKGRSKIEQQPLTESPSKVAFFGNPIDNNNSNDQLVELKGRTKMNSVFIYMPDAKVGISGGGNVSYSCSNGNCTGGNFHGAVWAKEWGLSGSNTARITVPNNMGEDIEALYPNFRLGNKSFVAAGTLGFKTINLNAP